MQDISCQWQAGGRLDGREEWHPMLRVVVVVVVAHFSLWLIPLYLKCLLAPPSSTLSLQDSALVANGK